MGSGKIMLEKRVRGSVVVGDEGDQSLQIRKRLEGGDGEVVVHGSRQPCLSFYNLRHLSVEE